MTKTVALFHPDQAYLNQLLPQFQEKLPDHQIIAWSADCSADYLMTWKPDPKIFHTPNVKVFFALGAGIDAFLNDPNFPKEMPIVRLEEAGMGPQMLEFALYAILHYSRDMVALNQGQRDKVWLGSSTPKKLPFTTKVGILGLGQLGGFIAESLAGLGYPVSGYSNSPKDLKGINCYHGDELPQLLANSEVLINLLPLTPHTENILNAELFAQLPKGAYLVNLARGKHLVEADLTAALDSGKLSGAFLDVYRVEPLPTTHPFWSDTRITMTPHLAAITVQSEAVRQISQNILAFEAGKPMTGLVDRTRGY